MTTRSFFWRICQVIARVGTTVLFDLRTHGIEHVPKTGGVLLVSNHASYLDPVLVAVRLKRPVSFLARASLFRNPVFAWLITSLHAFPIEQGKGDRGAINETIERLKQGHALNLYPEGTRTEDGKLQKIQAGVALVARKAGVPIVPAYIMGSFDAWPVHRKIPRPAKIRVLYGPPMHIDGMKAEEICRVIDETFHRLQAESQQIWGGK
jgi:1-acyl-sn-glycerol-3-phosphate acyltransferase